MLIDFDFFIFVNCGCVGEIRYFLITILIISRNFSFSTETNWQTTQNLNFNQEIPFDYIFYFEFFYIHIENFVQ